MAGEPIFVQLTVTNTGESPIVFDVGSDYRGTLVHLRYNWIVRDEEGRVVCDLSRQPPTFFGGKGIEVTLPPHQTYFDTQLLNPACDALVEPGRYVVTAVRRLTSYRQLPQADTRKTLVCDDLFPVEGSAAPATRPADRAACQKELARFPLVATDFVLEIEPWRKEAGRTRLGALVREAQAGEGDLSRRNARAWFFAYACERLRCDCPPGVPPTDPTPAWMAQFVEGMPDSLPAEECRR